MLGCCWRRRPACLKGEIFEADVGRGGDVVALAGLGWSQNSMGKGDGSRAEEGGLWI